MQITEPLIHGNYYHIYNRGNNRSNLFKEETNYEYFLKLYNRHIQPIADTYAFVLMKNHFHLLVRIKDLPEIKGNHKDKPPYQYFSNLFNAYSKAFNKKYNRTGSLFEKNFHRKKITSQDYLRIALLYIHNNPVHHKFCKHPSEYPWSSYRGYLSPKPTKLKRDQVIGWFNDVENFKYCHDRKTGLPQSNPEGLMFE